MASGRRSVVKQLAWIQLNERELLCDQLSVAQMARLMKANGFKIPPRAKRYYLIKFITTSSIVVPKVENFDHHIDILTPTSSLSLPLIETSAINANINTTEQGTSSLLLLSAVASHDNATSGDNDNGPVDCFNKILYSNEVRLTKEVNGSTTDESCGTPPLVVAETEPISSLICLDSSVDKYTSTKVITCRSCNQPTTDQSKFCSHGGVVSPSSSLHLTCYAPLCQKTFSNNAALKRHLTRMNHRDMHQQYISKFAAGADGNGNGDSSHNQSRPYACDINGCDKRFPTKYTLKRHKTIHSNLKPFVCTYQKCIKSFRDRYSFQIHMRVHLNQYDCPCLASGCDDRFVDSGNRLKHMRKHHVGYDKVAIYSAATYYQSSTSDTTKHGVIN